MKPIRNPRQLSLFTSSHEIDVQRAARLINTSIRTVHRLLESGDLHGYKLTPRGWWKISYDSVVAYINRIKVTYLPDSPAAHQLQIKTSPSSTDSTPLS